MLDQIISDQHGDSDLCHAIYLQLLRERELLHFAADNWPTSGAREDLAKDALLASYAEGGSNMAAVVQLRGAVAYVSLRWEHATVHVAAKSAKTAAAGVNHIRRLLPYGDRSKEDEVPVTFWSLSPNGPAPMRRNLKAPRWDEIADNYAGTAPAKIEQLLGWEPGRGGQLILWHGVAGTGKTTAIRALAQHWREWCDLHYVTDPDAFFGKEAHYMMSVLLEADVSRWRLLLLEDAGELLTADARARTGQGLSRFLNAVDGMIGQGLKLLILVTTNEELRKLNSAVSRHGRCAATIEFPRFDREAAGEWLTRRGVSTDVDAPRTLAELYAVAEGVVDEPERAFGFV